MSYCPFYWPAGVRGPTDLLSWLLLMRPIYQKKITHFILHNSPLFAIKALFTFYLYLLAAKKKQLPEAFRFFADILGDSHEGV